MQIICKCGNTLSDALIPNDIEFRVYTDREFDSLYDLESIKDIPLPKLKVLKCPNCHRVLVFEKKKLLHIYVIEE